eukprot:7780051-Pyramimonas_sp.AAC.1
MAVVSENGWALECAPVELRMPGLLLAAQKRLSNSPPWGCRTTSSLLWLLLAKLERRSKLRLWSCKPTSILP